MSMDRLTTAFAGVTFKNPVVLASGTCGFGREYHEIFDLQKLGGISSKGLTLHARAGNEGIRIWETEAGIMNSVGLENPGVSYFVENDLPWINGLDLVNIVNLGGHSMEDYLQGVEILNHYPLDLLELNISCPNIKAGGMNFGVKSESAREVVRAIRKICKHKLVVKLSPNAENIADLAKTCEAEGADGISLVNTFLSLAIDIQRRKPIFANGYAGLSGPAIKPIALRMVNQVAQAVNIPVMGMGGICTWQDAVEFIMAGAAVVQIGTGSFMKPDLALDVVEGLTNYAEEQGLRNIQEICGVI